MVLRDGMATRLLTGESGGHPIPGVSPTAVEYVYLLPNLLVSAHPDYVMTHQLVPLAPASPHFRPGSFAPDEDAVAMLVETLSGWYVG